MWRARSGLGGGRRRYASRAGRRRVGDEGWDDRRDAYDAVCYKVLCKI